MGRAESAVAGIDRAPDFERFRGQGHRKNIRKLTVGDHSELLIRCTGASLLLAQPDAVRRSARWPGLAHAHRIKKRRTMPLAWDG